MRTKVDVISLPVSDLPIPSFRSFLIAVLSQGESINNRTGMLVFWVGWKFSHMLSFLLSLKPA